MGNAEIKKLINSMQLHDIDRFHKHLDECQQCRENPFSMCQKGQELLVRAIERAK